VESRIAHVLISLFRWIPEGELGLASGDSQSRDNHQPPVIQAFHFIQRYHFLSRTTVIGKYIAICGLENIVCT